MPIPTDNQRNRVLHIRSTAAPNSLADKLGEQLAMRGVLEDVCGDLYHGLIRIGRGDSQQRQVVFVCLDELVPSEFEFFSLVSRANRSAEVYVYGSPRRGDDIAEAVRCGASGPVTQELLGALLTVPASGPAMGSCLETVNAGGSTDVQSNMMPVAPYDPDSQAPGEPISELAKPEAPIDERLEQDLQRELDAAESSADGAEEGGDGGESVDAAPRVPWLRYAATPARMPPARTGETEQPDSQRARRSVPEPLLTEAELRALIGDDIAGIAPPDRGSGPQDDSDLEGGDL